VHKERGAAQMQPGHSAQVPEHAGAECGSCTSPLLQQRRRRSTSPKETGGRFRWSCSIWSKHVTAVLTPRFAVVHAAGLRNDRATGLRRTRGHSR
jgi:hypothetical protein